MRIYHPWLLVADDDPIFRETVQQVLEAEGYRTLLASTGEEAVALARQRDVHVLLLDFHMPRLTGLEAFRLVRQVKHNVPCILMSGAIDPETIEQARREAVFEILTKPFSARQLSTVVRNALTQKYGF
ncbi:Phosphate regulon transcriptional regulatory protein PhoB (SphR) [Thermogutta terrifontis]|jgi:CheY-like chemotaxis protein|uniref:Phosphate regulon transcriptional regulatory protein PhoB (SphR) n=1 Tax=Thermogutta terrifontis TaxID=1331910 RepID=A0A286RKH9_9BACT|nr:response regulator [Thermogutta terrifontis]ASV76473.1 Phosphate regulon transcriptional regulatory protein PhoB (SphR) [Thermogutta terrifontis]